MIMGLGAILGTGTSILSSIMGFNAQKQQAKLNNIYKLQDQAYQMEVRNEQHKYQNIVYDNDIKYRKEVLDFRRDEFERQTEFVKESTENLEENYLTKVGQMLTRVIEENMASTFQDLEIQKQGTTVRASVKATVSERGFEGNTADALVGEVYRQEGESLNMSALNDISRQRQSQWDMKGLKAEHDTKIGSLQIQADAPLAPINQPGPLQPIRPAQMESGPSAGTLGVQIASAALSGLAGYRQANGLKF